MAPPELDRSSLKALDRSIVIMMAFLRALMFIERTIGLPRWVYKFLKRLDDEVTDIERGLIDAALKAELKDAYAKLAEHWGLTQAPVTDSHYFAISTPGVTAEAHLGATGCPSRDGAVSAEGETVHPNAPHVEASNANAPMIETPRLNAADFGLRTLSALQGDCGAASNHISTSTLGVTAETRLRVSSRPSRNSATRKQFKFTRERADSANTDQISKPKIKPRARPPPAPIQTSKPIQTIAASAVAFVECTPKMAGFIPPPHADLRCYGQRTAPKSRSTKHRPRGFKNLKVPCALGASGLGHQSYGHRFSGKSPGPLRTACRHSGLVALEKLGSSRSARMAYSV